MSDTPHIDAKPISRIFPGHKLDEQVEIDVGEKEAPCRPLYEGEKFDEGKLDLDLMPVEWEEWIVRVFEEGLRKGYARDNWKKGFEERRLMNAARRHINRDRQGEHIDPDGGNPHLVKAAWNLLALHWQRQFGAMDQTKEG